MALFTSFGPMKFGIGIGIALATVVSAVIFVAVIASIFWDIHSLFSAAGWWGLAAVLALPALIVIGGWRDLTR